VLTTLESLLHERLQDFEEKTEDRQYTEKKQTFANKPLNAHIIIEIDSSGS
jgi:hypothetical protein